MTDFDVYPELEREAPVWARFAFLGLSNALVTFLLCAFVLEIKAAAAGVLLLIGLLAVPCVTAAAVASYSARARMAPLSALASVGYFTLLLAFGVAIELGTLWALVQIYWGGPQIGA
jgi:hypothetical protein